MNGSTPFFTCPCLPEPVATGSVDFGHSKAIVPSSNSRVTCRPTPRTQSGGFSKMGKKCLTLLYSPV